MTDYHDSTTLVLVNSPTLRDGMGELLRIADALSDASTLETGVCVTRHVQGYMVCAEPDFDVPAGVIETDTTGTPVAWPEDPWFPSRDLLEAVHGHTDGDVVATTGGVWWL